MNQQVLFRYRLRGLTIAATLFFFVASNSLGAMETEAPEKKEDIQNKLKFLEDKKFINSIFQKYQKMRDNFGAGLDEKCGDEYFSLAKDAVLYIKKYSDSYTQVNANDPDVQFALFLVTLFLGGLENEALALLEHNPQWATKLPYIVPKKFEMGNIKVIDAADIETTIHTWRRIYIIHRAISSDYMRVAQFLILNAPDHIYKKQDFVKEVEKSIFEVLLEKDPWDFINNLTAYKMKYKDLLANDAIRALSKSEKISEEDFLPGGQGYDLAFKWSFSCSPYKLSFYWETVESLKKILKSVDYIRSFKLLPPNPANSQNANSKEERDHKIDVTGIDARVLRECLKRSEYDPMCYQENIDFLKKNAQWKEQKSEKRIKEKQTYCELAYLQELVDAKKEGKKSDPFVVFSKAKLEKIETKKEEFKIYQEHAQSLVKVYEEKPNQETQIVDLLMKKVMKLGAYNEGEKTFKNFSEYSSIVAVFLNAVDILEIPNEYLPNKDSNGVTEILWSEVNLGTRRFTASPREFIELIISELEID